MIVVQVPLRVSFFGGGTDLPVFYRREEGAVLSSAIDKYVYVIVKERFDDLIYVNYSRKEIVADFNDLRHELVREAMRATGVTRGVEITTLADVPSEGSGLGSSGSITVALLLALYTYQGALQTAEQLAEEACRIEMGLRREIIGKQDQYIAAFGRLHVFRFCPDETVNVDRVDLPDDTRRRLTESLMLFYTNRTRAAYEILAAQQENTESRLATLRAMRAQVAQGRHLLQGGDIEGFGHLLHEAWELKRQLASGISTRQIEGMYMRARRAGALGGKIAGAGGGGFLLLCCPPGVQEAVREALKGYRELHFDLARDGARVVFHAHT